MRVVCHSLKVDDLFLILKNSEGSIIRQYEQDFAAYGIEVLFADEGLRRIAERAGDEQTGARGLMTVCERVFRDIKFELPSTKVKRFVVTRELVDDPAGRAAEDPGRPETGGTHRGAATGGRIRAALPGEPRHDASVSRTPRRTCWSRRRWRRSQPVRDLCATRFKDFQFGLKLIAQNSGQQEFVIDADAVEAPGQGAERLGGGQLPQVGCSVDWSCSPRPHAHFPAAPPEPRRSLAGVSGMCVVNGNASKSFVLLGVE